MFSGMVEKIGIVMDIHFEEKNIYMTVYNPFEKSIKRGQSISHNGVCLTVLKTTKENYTVNAVLDSLYRSALKTLKVCDQINLERSLHLGSEIGGHFVPGHVNYTQSIESIETKNNSWLFQLRSDTFFSPIIEMGSVAINGVSLTVVESKNFFFSVVVIPYTFFRSNFHLLRKGQKVNLEFDILGKNISHLIHTVCMT